MKKLLFLSLLLISSVFAHAACTTTQNFVVNNAWTPAQTIPYGMVLEIYNPAGSGCDLYVTKLTMSAGSNLPYFMFGTAFATALMPGCTVNLQVVDLSAPSVWASLPGGIVGVGLPCGAYVNIGTVSDKRWVLTNGHPYEEDFGNSPRKITPGSGYSIWTSPAGYPTITNGIGDLGISLAVKTCPTGISC